LCCHEDYYCSRQNASHHNAMPPRPPDYVSLGNRFQGRIAVPGARGPALPAQGFPTAPSIEYTFSQSSG
jgi:hypothetical protein